MTSRSDEEFLRLLELAVSAAPSQRATLLKEQGADQDTIASVLKLVRDEGRTEDFLENVGDPLAGLELGNLLKSDLLQSNLELPMQFGQYKLVKALGTGGMGQVFLATQETPIQRDVAIKLTLNRRLSDTERSLFAKEQQALAKLSHPNIAQIFEVGSTDEGLPFFVMEHVDGRKITEYCDTRCLNIEQRLSLFEDVARAIHHAHQKRLLHLDLKPSNVLVTEIEGRAVPKIIDFGIALNLDSEEEERKKASLGTPNYASPELLAPDRSSDSLDTRADVYGLGALLFELLSGRTPTALDPTSESSPFEQLLASDRIAPSEVFKSRSLEVEKRSVSSARSTTEPTLIKTLQGDLDAICMKAIALDREDRFGSALELSQELERFAANEPVQSRPRTLPYLARKFFRRNRLPVAASFIAGVAVLGALGAVLIALQESQASEARAEATVDFLQELLEFNTPYKARRHTPQRSGAMPVNELMLEGAARAEEQLADQPEVQAGILYTIGNILRGYSDPEAPVPVLERALELRLSELGNEHPDTLLTRHVLGLAYERLGRYEEAEDNYTRSFQSLVSLFGPEDPRTVAAQVDLAQIQFSRNQSDPESTVALKQALAAAEKAGLGVLFQAEMLNSLGWDAYHKKRPQEAMSYVSRAMALHDEYFPEKHSSVALMRHNLGVMSIAAGKIEEAEILVNDAIEIYAETTEPDFWRNANSLGFVGVIKMHQGKYEEAEKLMLDGLDGIVAGTGPDTVYAEDMRGYLVELYERWGKPDLAARYRRQQASS
ncbi:MAG: serine/threonine-protein kinase [Pseudomonadota bacterium]